MSTRSAAVWGLTVLTIGGDEPTSVVVMQPATDSQHEQVATGVKAAGFAKVTRHDWTRGTWPLALTGGATVYSVNRLVTWLHTGRASIYAAPPALASEFWLATAQARGRVLAAVVPAGALDDIGDDDMFADPTHLDRLTELARKRRLLAGLVRFAPDPADKFPLLVP